MVKAQSKEQPLEQLTDGKLEEIEKLKKNLKKVSKLNKSLATVIKREGETIGASDYKQTRLTSGKNPFSGNVNNRNTGGLSTTGVGNAALGHSPRKQISVPKGDPRIATLNRQGKNVTEPKTSLATHAKQPYEQAPKYQRVPVKESTDNPSATGIQHKNTEDEKTDERGKESGSSVHNLKESDKKGEKKEDKDITTGDDVKNTFFRKLLGRKGKKYHAAGRTAINRNPADNNKETFQDAKEENYQQHPREGTREGYTGSQDALGQRQRPVGQRHETKETDEERVTHPPKKEDKPSEQKVEQEEKDDPVKDKLSEIQSNYDKELKRIQRKYKLTPNFKIRKPRTTKPKTNAKPQSKPQSNSQSKPQSNSQSKPQSNDLQQLKDKLIQDKLAKLKQSGKGKIDLEKLKRDLLRRGLKGSSKWYKSKPKKKSLIKAMIKFFEKDASGYGDLGVANVYPHTTYNDKTYVGKPVKRSKRRIKDSETYILSRQNKR